MCIVLLSARMFYKWLLDLVGWCIVEFFFFFIIFSLVLLSVVERGMLKSPTVAISSVTQSCPTLCNPMNCRTPGLPVHHQLLEFTQTHVHWVGDAIQPSHPHPLLFLPSIFPSIRVFPNESALRIRWPKYWSFSFNISPSSEYPGLISFRMDWLNLLAVQGTLKSLLQYHSSKASILWHSALSLTSIHDYWKIQNHRHLSK